MSFPIRSSETVTGVEMSCSIVPRSHSRAIVSEVRRPAMTIMMTAINPGMMKFLLSSSGLNQTRTWTSSGIFPTRNARPGQRLEDMLLGKDRVIADTYPTSTWAVSGSAPVGDQLHLGPPLGLEIGAETLRDDDGRFHLARVYTPDRSRCIYRCNR